MEARHGPQPSLGRRRVCTSSSTPATSCQRRLASILTPPMAARMEAQHGPQPALGRRRVRTSSSTPATSCQRRLASILTPPKGGADGGPAWAPASAGATESAHKLLHPRDVMPAKAGIHTDSAEGRRGWRPSMGPSLRWGDDEGVEASAKPSASPLRKRPARSPAGVRRGPSGRCRWRRASPRFRC